MYPVPFFSSNLCKNCKIFTKIIRIVANPKSHSNSPEPERLTGSGSSKKARPRLEQKSPAPAGSGSTTLILLSVCISYVLGAAGGIRIATPGRPTWMAGLPPAGVRRRKGSGQPTWVRGSGCYVLPPWRPLPCLPPPPQRRMEGPLRSDQRLLPRLAGQMWRYTYVWLTWYTIGCFFFRICWLFKKKQCCGPGMIYSRSGSSFEFSGFRIRIQPILFK